MSKTEGVWNMEASGSLLCCPICGKGLSREEGRYFCPDGHSYDRAREGYVHLLPANRKHAKEPGDDKGMSAARNRFLSGGYYAHLLERLQALAVERTGPGAAVLDSGCGEGYYTQGVWQALTQAGHMPRLAGIDLSRPAIRLAARRLRAGEFAVASAYHLPVGTQTVDLLLNCFSPWHWRSFGGCSAPAGRFSMWCRGRTTCGS